MYLFRHQIRVGRADGFVGLLGIFAGGIIVGRLRQIVFAVAIFDEPPTALDGVLRHKGAVGTHIGNQAQCAHRAEVNPFVKLLGDHHRAFGGKSEPIGRGLLERRGDKRRRRTRLHPAGRYIRNGKGRLFDLFKRRQCLFFVVGMKLIAIDVDKIGAKRVMLGQPFVLLGDGSGVVVADG